VPYHAWIKIFTCVYISYLPYCRAVCKREICTRACWNIPFHINNIAALYPESDREFYIDDVFQLKNYQAGYIELDRTLQSSQIDRSGRSATNNYREQVKDHTVRSCLFPNALRDVKYFRVLKYAMDLLAYFTDRCSLAKVEIIIRSCVSKLSTYN